MSVAMKAGALIFLCVLAGGCGGGSAAGPHGGAVVVPDADVPDAADVLPARGRVEVTPRAALFTAVDEQAVFQARAFDPGGQPLAGAITWRSSNPEVVSIDVAPTASTVKVQRTLEV